MKKKKMCLGFALLLCVSYVIWTVFILKLLGEWLSIGIIKETTRIGLVFSMITFGVTGIGYWATKEDEA